MGDSYISEGMLEVFVYESEMMLDKIEQLAMEKEETSFDEEDINEIFRSMHTIKGSSAVMMYNSITSVSHKLEDIFYYIREAHPKNLSQKKLVEHLLLVTDFIKGELDKIKNGEQLDGNPEEIDAGLEEFLETIKADLSEEGQDMPPERSEKEVRSYYVAPVIVTDSRFYIIQVYFKPYVEMQNIKAYTMIYSLKEFAENLYFEPEDIMTNEQSAQQIANEGFNMALQARLTPEEIMNTIDHVGGTDNIEIHECTAKEVNCFIRNGARSALEMLASASGEASEETKIQHKHVNPLDKEKDEKTENNQESTQKKQTELITQHVTREKEAALPKQAFISVNVQKMDYLMDLIGELVIAEAVVLQNPDLKVPGLDLSNFQKAAAQLSKITTELQDIIMMMRMMPLNNTFQKMKRIVHDVSGKLGKEVELHIVGENTEVDKNIIEHISDPLMHLIRNSVDHGIEDIEGRKKAGKPEKGRVVLEAKNEGGKVWISVSDDGKGLSREKILAKAEESGLLADKPVKEMSDREVYSLITYPGFSTKEEVSEYSGRGVGMDVVMQNIQHIGGSLDIESVEGEGSKMTMKIPLTLAIIDGIILGVGSSTYVVATGNVKEFLRVSREQLIVEPEGTESIMLRGECYPIMRLKKFYGLKDGEEDIENGIVTILEHEGKNVAVFIDKLIGEQEIVVKPIPSYIKKIRGLSGCTQLGDGSISLILDAGSLIKD